MQKLTYTLVEIFIVLCHIFVLIQESAVKLLIFYVLNIVRMLFMLIIMQGNTRINTRKFSKIGEGGNNFSFDVYMFCLRLILLSFLARIWEGSKERKHRFYGKGQKG
jgi:hypothetical protein